MKFPNGKVLYAITDTHNLKMPLTAAVREAVKNGAGIVQIRDKDITDEDYPMYKDAAAICHEYGVPIVVDDYVELVNMLGVDGVHLGLNDMSIKKARKILGADAIIGATVKTPEQAAKAEADGASYLGTGAAFLTGTKSDATLINHEMYKKIKAAVNIPIVAVGGITCENVCELAGLGLDGAAVSSAIFSACDVAVATRELAAAVRNI